MAEIEKLKDGELDEATGGTKYNVGNIPVPVHPYPNGPILYYLTPGDYLVTDGQVIVRDGVRWCHVFTAYGEGCVDGIREFQLTVTVASALVLVMPVASVMTQR